MDLREMELRDTVEMMNSADYKERFKAEYYQTARDYLTILEARAAIEGVELDG